MRPRLVHPVACKIQRIDQAATQIDPVFREPVGGTDYQEPVEIRAQVKFSRHAQQNMVPGGDSPLSAGSLIMEREEYDRLGGFVAGDKITEIAGEAVDLYLIEVQPAGVYSGRAWLMRLVFESRPRG
ncbi:MAG: hypothetical protein ACM3X6_02850 [Patescibacteria group bacterium]